MITKVNPIEACYRERVAAGKPVVRLFDGNPMEHGFCFPPEILSQCYQHYFKNEKYRPDPKGDLSARQAIARYYAAQDFFIHPDHLILTPGTSESFFYLFSLLTQPGDNILTPNPAYPLFDDIAAMVHIEMRHYTLDENKHWQINIADLASKIDARTRAIVIISPNNPTGAVASPEELREISKLAHRHSFSVICDEVFSEFLLEDKTLPRFANNNLPPLLFVLNGISKMFALPALKLGWIGVLGESTKAASVVDRLETIADIFLSTHTPIQRALPILFEQGRDFLAQYKKEVRERNQLAVRLLSQSEKISFVAPQGGFYLTAKIDSKKNISEEGLVIDLMKQTGIFVHPGYFYDYEQGTHMILSFLAEPSILEPSLKKIVHFLDK